MLKALPLVALLLAPNLAPAAGFTAEQRLQDFQQLRALIQSQYGPFEFKQQTGVLNFEQVNQEFEARIKAAKTNQEFYSLIAEYIGRFKDGHFTVLNHTKRTAAVPVNVDLLEGKVYISFVNREKLKKEDFDAEPGDEILKVDGVDVAQAMEPFARVAPTGNERNRARKAAWALTGRNNMLHPIPAGEHLVLTVRRANSSIVQDFKIPWTKKEEAFDEDEVTGDAIFQLASASPGTGLLSNWDLRAVDQAFYVNPLADRRYMCNAESRVKVPEGAEWIMKKPIQAYTFPSAKGKLGYVRIPDYYPVNDAGEITEASVKAWFEKLRFVVQKLEASTVGLVIDQDSNCGGSVALVEDVITLFANEPVKPMQFRFRASKAKYLRVKKEFDELTPDTLEYESYKKFMTAMATAIKSARGSMTELLPITGRDLVYPDRAAHYSKPIVILIDENAGSGGDAFPSIMKGIGRAKLFGQQTGGLGGSVEEMKGGLNHSQMDVRMTVSLFYKPDGTPVENNGAVPDRVYEETKEDMLYQYQPRRDAYIKYLLEQIP